MSEPINELMDILSEARSPVERKLLFLGWLNRRLGERGAQRFPILVGGSAVAFYTGGNYSTVDIDLVYDAGDAFNEILVSVGFERRGRYWEQDELDLQVECPGAEAEAPGRVDRVVLKNGDVVYISSIEEVIIDRLLACDAWRSQSDCEWTRTLLASEGYDWEYVKARAEEEGR